MSGLDEEARYRAVLALDRSSPSTLAPMVAGLYDESWRVRRAAAEQLARRGDDGATLDRLLHTLADAGQTGARNAAAEALVRMGARALRAATGLLGHRDPDQRKFGAEILGQLGLPAAREALIAALGDPELNVQVAAAEALGAIGGEASARALEPLLPGAPPLLQLSALEALARIGRAPPLPSLTPLLHEPRVRRSAYRVLGLVRHPSAVSMLARGLSEPTASVREAALAGIGRQALEADASARAALEAALKAEARSSPELRELLASTLETGEREVRAGALVVCAALGELDLAPAIAESARDDSLFEEVVRTLERLGPVAARALVSRVLELSTPARAAAVDALAKIADPTLVPTLEQTLASGDPELQQIALQSLGRAASPKAIAPLIARLGDPQLGPSAARALVALGKVLGAGVSEALVASLEQRPTATGASALATIDPAAMVPLLPRLVRDSHAALRAAALAGSASAGVESCLELCQIGLGDEAPEVRRAAASALARCSDARADGLLRRALTDEDLSVRAAAVTAAGERAGTSLAADLEQLAVGRDAMLAVAALGSLTRLGAITPAVLEAAGGHPDPEVLKQALAAGAPLREGAALAVRLLEHPRWDVRAAAAQALADSGDGECRAAVERALSTEADPLVCGALRRALDRLSSR